MISLDIRSLFIPRPGKRMMAPDLSQIEPRVLAWLVKDQEMLDKMAAGISPYQSFAESKMGWREGDMKTLIKAGRADVVEKYALSKAQVLGLGFGCGWNKFITVAQDMAGLDITKDDPEWTPALNDEGQQCINAAGEVIMESGYGMNSRRIVKEFRSSNPLITDYWKRLDTAFRNSVGGTFEMEMPSGRVLRYPEVMREHKRIADPDRPGKWLSKWVFSALVFDKKRNSVIRKSLYGGLLTENIVQATARDIFMECCLALDATPGINVLWTVHDEAVIECDPHIEPEHVQEIMGRPVPWAPGLPIACEVSVIPYYTK